MDLSIAEAICFYFGIDYNYFKGFYKNWLTIRGICRRVNISSPQIPRVYISIPLKDKSLKYDLDIDSDDVESSLYSEDTLKGDILSRSSSEDGDLADDNFIKELPYLQKIRSTPDILRATLPNKNIISERSCSSQSLIDEELDPGFCSDRSCVRGGTTLQKLDELQKQFSKMQRDIAALVQVHSNVHLMSSNTSFFTPNMTSSPNCKAESGFKIPMISNLLHFASPVQLLAPPPPPSAPPPPPLASIDWKQSLHDTKDGIRRIVPKGIPDMTEILRGISSVKLRPVKRDVLKDNSNSPENVLMSRTPLRRVSKQESIIASALRDRFNKYHMLNDDESSVTSNISDDWTVKEEDDSTNNLNLSRLNFGRPFLRKVDRSQLPATVCRDFVTSTD